MNIVETLNVSRSLQLLIVAKRTKCRTCLKGKWAPIAPGPRTLYDYATGQLPPLPSYCEWLYIPAPMLVPPVTLGLGISGKSCSLV